jgi:hypothetical protein
MRPYSESGASANCPTCGTKSEKLVSLFASKENYTIKVPRGEAYRGRDRATPASSAGAGARAETAPRRASSAAAKGKAAAKKR